MEEHGVFGTPTFVFETGNAVYLKTFIPPEEDSVAFFEHFVGMMAHRSYVGELKAAAASLAKRSNAKTLTQSREEGRDAER